MVTLIVICFWNNKENSVHIPSDLSAKTLASTLKKLSDKSPYAETLSSYTSFCEKLFAQLNNTDLSTYNILLLLQDEKTHEYKGFLSAQAIYESIEINFICVHVHCRQTGLAEKLYQFLEQKLRAEYLKTRFEYKAFLEVSEKNTAALNLYKKLGFHQTSIRPKYYFNTENACLMVKNII